MGKFHPSPKNLEEGNAYEWEPFHDEKPSNADDGSKSKRFVVGLVVAVLLLVLPNFGALLAATFIAKDAQQNSMRPDINEGTGRKLGGGNTDVTTRITSYTIGERVAMRIKDHCVDDHKVELKRIWYDGSYSLRPICFEGQNPSWDGATETLTLANGITMSRISGSSEFQLSGNALLQDEGWICDVDQDCDDDGSGNSIGCNGVNRCGPEGEEGDNEPGQPGFCQLDHPFTQTLPTTDLSVGLPDRPDIDGEFGDYSAMLALPMFNGGKSGTNDPFTMEGQIATAYIAYDCVNRIVCAAVHLTEDAIEEGIEVDESDEDSWIRFGTHSGATKLKASNADEFEYIHKDDTYTTGYEGCWNVCDIHPPLDPVINNDVEIHFNTVTGQTTSTGRQNAEGMNICLISSCSETVCPEETTTTSSTPDGGGGTTTTPDGGGGSTTPGSGTTTTCTSDFTDFTFTGHGEEYQCGEEEPDFTQEPDVVPAGAIITGGDISTDDGDVCIGINTTVEWTATYTDNCGEEHIDSFFDVFTEIDTTDPTIDVETIPEDLEMDSCDYNDNGIPDHSVTASDSCDEDPSVVTTLEYVEETLPPGLTLTRIFTAKDACGQTSGGLDSQTIEVVDKCYTDVKWGVDTCANFPSLLTIENMEPGPSRPNYFIRITVENTESDFLGDLRGVFFDCSDGINWDLDSDDDSIPDWNDGDTEGPIWIEFVEWVMNPSPPPSTITAGAPPPPTASTTSEITYECRPDGDFTILGGWSGGCIPDPISQYTCAVEVGSPGQSPNDVQKVVFDVYSNHMDVTTDTCAGGSNLVGFRHTAVSDATGDTTSRQQSTKTKADLFCCQAETPTTTTTTTP